MKIFKETQRFNQWWLIILEVVILIIILIDFVKEYQQIDVGTNSKSLTEITISLVGVILVLLFLHTIKLRSKIDETGVSYQFFPVHLNFKNIPWSDLSKCYVRKYAAITEYGGWGIRGLSKKGLFGYKKVGRAFNIKGNMGIQLEFKDGGRLLIGTQDPEKAKLTINSYHHLLKNNS